MYQLIIKTLKKYPEFNISQIAELLDVTPMEVGEAQRTHLRRFIPRESPMWGDERKSVIKR